MDLNKKILSFKLIKLFFPVIFLEVYIIVVDRKLPTPYPVLKIILNLRSHHGINNILNKKPPTFMPNKSNPTISSIN